MDNQQFQNASFPILAKDIFDAVLAGQRNRDRELIAVTHATMPGVYVVAPHVQFRISLRRLRTGMLRANAGLADAFLLGLGADFDLADYPQKSRQHVGCRLH